VSFKIIMTTSVTRPCFTTQHQNQDQDQARFFSVSDRSCPKTDGLRPHHWHESSFDRMSFLSSPMTHTGDPSSLSESH